LASKDEKKIIAERKLFLQAEVNVARSKQLKGQLEQDRSTIHKAKFLQDGDTTLY